MPQDSDGRAFDQVAAEYNRHRPAYPDRVIDLACERAGLERGDHVLEIGCGTGQLTRSLLHRGLRVTAIELGARFDRASSHVSLQLDGWTPSAPLGAPDQLLEVEVPGLPLESPTFEACEQPVAHCLP